MLKRYHFLCGEAAREGEEDSRIWIKVEGSMANWNLGLKSNDPIKYEYLNSRQREDPFQGRLKPMRERRKKTEKKTRNIEFVKELAGKEMKDQKNSEILGL